MHSFSSILRHSKLTRVFGRSVHLSSATGKQAKKLEGRVAIAPGCTDGIGFQMAKRLAEDGAHVVLGSRNQKNVDSAIEKLKAEGLANVSGYACHIADEEQRNALIRRTADEHGGFDIIVNNAGVNAHKGPILATQDSAFDKVFDVNVKANFCLVRDSVPYMKNRRHQGAIVLTSSASAYRSAVYDSAYAISKTAVISLVHAFAPELYKHNIRINCLVLGLFTTAFAEFITSNEKLKNYYMDGFTIMRRPGKPSECGPITSFLCSDDSSYVTGESFCLTGGVYCHL